MIHMVRPPLSSIVTIALWVVVWALVLNAAVVPFSRLTIRWAHPGRSNGVFRWQQAVDREPGWLGPSAVISNGDSRTFSVTLPRGFTTADVIVMTSPPGNGRLAAVRRTAADAAGQPTATDLRLQVRLSELFAQGRSFSFTVANQNPDPLIVRAVRVTLNR